MPFIPHTPDDVEQMLAAIGAKCDRRSVRRDSEGPAHRVARGHSGRAQRDADRPTDVGARGAGRHAAQLHRRRRVRTPHSLRGVGHHHARRVLQRLHAVPGRGLAGHAAAHLRIPDDDFLAHRHGSLECIAVRRRLGRRGSVAHGDPRAPEVEVAAHPGADHACIRTTARWRCATASEPGRALRGNAVSEGRDSRRGPREVQGRGHHRARDPAAELLRRARRCRRAHRLGACARHHGHRLGESHVARHSQAAGRVGHEGRGHRLWRLPAARRAAVLGWPVCGFPHDPDGIRAPDAGPHRRPHRRLRTASRASRSRCRRASSTSAAARRPRTSAPTRACWSRPRRSISAC